MSLTVLQVGEGRFLRAFLDVLLDQARASGFVGRVVLTAPRPSGAATLDLLRARQGRYRVVVRGAGPDQIHELAPFDRIVDAYREPAALAREVSAPVPLVVVSNTTEAGLGYRGAEDPRAPTSYPARILSALLWRRAAGVHAPVALVPCELVADNARVLAESMERHARDWGAAPDWEDNVSFCDTLVDRIVTSGDPADPLACFTEPFASWYIGQAPDWLRDALPLDPGVVHWVEDVRPARERKVRLLNGAHTLMAVLGLQLGVSTVAEALAHPDLGPLVRGYLFGEGIASFAPEARAAAREFAAAVLARFLNPAMTDPLARLALQLSAKVRARWLPVLEGHRQQMGDWPPRLTLGLAAYLTLAGSPTVSKHLDLAQMDDAEWIGRLRALWELRSDPLELLQAAAAEAAWPGPRDPDILARVARHLRGDLRAELRSLAAAEGAGTPA